MDNDSGYHTALRRGFGQEVFDEEGKVDRVKLGELIFKNPEKRRLLDKISHPRIFRKIIKEIFRLKVLNKRPLVVLDAPLLYETRILEYFCYPNIVVYCDNTAE